MAPLAWKLLEEGEEVHAVISPGYDPRRRPPPGAAARATPRFHLHELWPRRRRVRRRCGPHAALRAGAAAAPPRPRRRRRVGLRPADGLRPPALRRRRRSRCCAASSRSLRPRSSATRSRPRANFIVAARLLRPPDRLPAARPERQARPAPPTSVGEALATGGPLTGATATASPPTSSTPSTTAAATSTTPRATREVMQTWGSLRWAPEWFELNRTLAPPFDWPEPPRPAEGRASWSPSGATACTPTRPSSCVRRLQALDFVSLAVKGHPRPSDGQRRPAARRPRRSTGTRIHDVSGVDSVVAHRGRRRRDRRRLVDRHRGRSCRTRCWSTPPTSTSCPRSSTRSTASAWSRRRADEVVALPATRTPTAIAHEVDRRRLRRAAAPRGLRPTREPFDVPRQLRPRMPTSPSAGRDNRTRQEQETHAMPTPHRIFIGYDPSQHISFEVLEVLAAQARDRAARGPADRRREDPGLQPRASIRSQSTPFTYTRFLVPYLVRLRGHRAVHGLRHARARRRQRALPPADGRPRAARAPARLQPDRDREDGRQGPDAVPAQELVEPDADELRRS